MGHEPLRTTEGLSLAYAQRVVSIGGLQWLDYVQAGPRRAMTMVTTQKKTYLDPGPGAPAYYGPLHAGFRRALNSVDPAAELDRVVGRAVASNLGKAKVYRQAADGFLRLLPRGATGVKVAESAWSEAELQVRMHQMLGVRLLTGEQLLVAPYCKEPVLDPESADVLLYLMESQVKQMLPEATPVVFDTRRGRRFKLHRRANRRQLDACARGMAVGYVRQWELAA